MSEEDTEKRPDKVTHRTMGDYSISKSYKGILRIAHIMELVDSEPDYFLSPTYYGNPEHLMNISGGAYKTKEMGYQTAIKAMQPGGGIQRYESSNVRIGNDPLKKNMVPMTDSMGNYLNWNVNTEGVTIGSNEDINGNYFNVVKFKQYQGEKSYIVYQEKIFPVLQTRDLTVGLENMMVASNKKGINDATVSVESGTKDAMIIVENLYDVSPKNRTTFEAYRVPLSGDEREPVELGTYKNIVDGEFQTYSKLRTIYKNTKQFSEDYDAFMFRQNDFDVENYNYTDENSEKDNKVNSTDNGYNSPEGQPSYNQQVCDVIKTGKKIRDSIVDVVNLKDYVKKIILKYMKGNVIEVPSGAVIWQYCSLEKWRAHREGSEGNATYLGEGGFPGHRPPLQIKETQSNNIFAASTIQGVCKKINRLKRNGNLFKPERDKNQNDLDSGSEDTTSMAVDENSDSLREIIPLYKRDYVLCDGSKYRIPYSAPLQKAAMTPFYEHQQRFFELFFNIGYRYTERKKMQMRPKVIWDSSKQIYIPCDSSSSKTKKVPINETNITNSCLNESWFTNFDKLPEAPPYDQWHIIKNSKNGYGYPAMIHPSEQEYDNCTDLDVLFQEDIATMTAIDLIYKEYHSKTPLGGKEWNFENVKHWLLNQRLPEEYIFNTFVGDLDNDVSEYFNVSRKDDKWFVGFESDGSVKLGHDKSPNVMKIQYRYCPNNEKPILPIGREVTFFASPMKFYDNSRQRYVITAAGNLPMINFFIYLMTSNHKIDGSLQMYFFSFYNYDFQVPNFMNEEKTPTLIGSGAFCENDDKKYTVRVAESWSSNFSEGDYPHRHGVFLWTGKGNGDTGASVNPPGEPNENFNDPAFYKLPNFSKGITMPTALMSYSGGVVTNLNKAGKHGGSLTNHDGNGNYIIKPIQMASETVTGTSYCPYTLMQSNETTQQFIGWETGLGYKNGSSKMSDDNPDKYEYFEENEGSEAVNFTNRIKYSYSFSSYDDPRFQNAEPNRGLSSVPQYLPDSFKFPKYKGEDARAIFGGTTDINWFTPENIQMLPLIKL